MPLREVTMLEKRGSASSLEKSDTLPFSFRSQVEFNAAQHLVRSRSECFLESKRSRDRMIREEEAKNRTPWDTRPPDFTLQLYQPKPPKRNSRYAMIPGYDEDEWIKNAKEKRRQKVQFERIPLPKILQPPVSNKPPFNRQFRIMDSHEAKITYVRSGIHKREPYTTPGPHAFRGDDFRPLESPNKYGLPEFSTSYEHDPGNLKFHSRNLNVLYDRKYHLGEGLRHCVSSAYKDQEFLNSKDGYRKQMMTFKEQDPRWEASLILPKGPYKRGRSAKSALMDRIAKQLPWCSDYDRVEQLRRPDIFDYKTVDWLEVTAYDKTQLNRI